MADMLTRAEMNDRYRELPPDFEYPYFYETRKGDQEIYFVGARHSYEPSDPQYDQVKSLWAEFLSKTEDHPRVVYIEGGYRRPDKNENTAIQNNAEAGLMEYLAHLSGTRVESPEPDDRQLLETMADQFGKEAVVHNWFAAWVLQWQRLSNRPTIRRYIQDFLDNYHHTTQWEDFDFSFDNLVKIHERLTGKQFNPDDKETVAKIADPGQNEVRNAITRIRDEYILAKIKKEWDNGTSLFIVYGSGHAITLEPAIKALAK